MDDYFFDYSDFLAELKEKGYSLAENYDQMPSGDMYINHYHDFKASNGKLIITEDIEVSFILSPETAEKAKEINLMLSEEFAVYQIDRDKNVRTIYYSRFI